MWISFQFPSTFHQWTFRANLASTPLYDSAQASLLLLLGGWDAQRTESCVESSVEIGVEKRGEMEGWRERSFAARPEH